MWRVYIAAATTREPTLAHEIESLEDDWHLAEQVCRETNPLNLFSKRNEVRAITASSSTIILNRVRDTKMF